MIFNIVLQSEAILDIQEAFEWYEKQKAGLGFELIEEIENGYEKLGKHPLHYTAINDKFRRIKINRFPYLIVFEIEENNIIITQLKHTSRKPEF